MKKYCSIYYLSDETKLPKYVGATTQELRKRLYTHLSVSKNNKTLKDKWILKNRKNITINLIEVCEFEDAVIKEKYWINFYKDTILNSTSGGEGLIIGWKHTEKTKKKISKTKIENYSDELVKNLSESHKGIKMTEENIKKLSERMKGNKYSSKNRSEEFKKNYSEKYSGVNSPSYGKKHTKETKEKISNSLKGNIPVNKGKPMSEEQKLKLKEAWIKRKEKFGNPTFGRKK